MLKLLRDEINYANKKTLNLLKENEHISLKGESSAFAMNFSLCLVVDMRLTSSHRHLLSLFLQHNK